MTETKVQELVTEEEWLDAFPVMRQLREHLDEREYLQYVHQMSADGYRLFGLFSGDQLAAVAGVDIMTDMYYGRQLWVFELVTDTNHRSKGYGSELFQYLIKWAESRGCEKVALSSGLQRERAHRFYENHVNMDKASYVYTLSLE